jgi:hypothetical protein
LWGKLKIVVYTNNPHDLEALQQNIREAIHNIQQRELQQVSRNLYKLVQACLTAEIRHFEYNINCYILSTINERSKQCVLAVTAARQHFSRLVAKGVRKKLPSVKAMSNQPAL